MSDKYIVEKTDLTSVANAIREKNKTNDGLMFPDGFVSAIQAGGGAELNFEVIGSTTQPSNPKENTIWVNTSTEITGWSFSATEPDIPIEGVVWVNIDVNGTHMINAVSKNEIELSIISVKQYISDAWVSKTAYIYISGEWDLLIQYIYNKGNLYLDFTGGFELTAWKINSTTKGATNNVSVSYNTEQIVIKKTGTSSSHDNGSAFTTVNKIDLSAYNTLTAKGRFYAYDSYSISYLRMFVEDSKSTPWINADASKAVSAVNIAQDEMVLDVSGLSGSYYIGFGMYTSEDERIEITIDEMYLT